MGSVADLIEGVGAEILRGVRARVDDVQMHGLAEQALQELVRSLRTSSTSLPAFPIAIYVEVQTRTLRELSTHVLDAIESQASTKDVRRVTEWFATASEHALNAANRRFVAMLDALDDHVLLLDTSAHALFLNASTEDAARENYGRSRMELIGRNTLEGSQSQEMKQYVRGLIARASAGEAVAQEFLLPLPGGAVWHEHHVRPVRGPGGDVEAVAIASRDIHARKQAEGRLRLLSKIGLLAATSELDSMLGHAAGLAVPELADWSVFELVQDGELHRATIVHPDAALAAQAERQLTEARCAVPRRLDDVEPGGRIYLLDADDGALRARDPELHALLERFGASTAIVVPFFVMGAPIALATFVFGRESGRRHIPSDLGIADEIARRAAQVVENARLQAEVAQALAYRERVMGILGHDLRNPITAVLSVSALLARRDDIPERAKEGLRHIHSSAERMELMIKTILDFTQLRFRGAPSLALETFDLGILARTIVDELRAANPSRAITIDASGELRGRWDVGRMGQVISNLVGNALTHGVHDAPVAVNVTSADDRVRVAVTNRGPTIPSEALGKLFEPFWQGAKPGTKSRGLGLGLFIVQQIVQAHGAAITVQSRDDQTTFTVQLPRSTATNQPP